MRRKDREIKNFEAIVSVIGHCRVCRIAFFDADYPYIVPLNFGFEAKGETLTLYFHCANEGKKLELLRANNNVAFEMDRPKEFIDGEKACFSTMLYESVCGTGTLSITSEDDKIQGLTVIMRQYSDKREIIFDDKALKDVTVLKLTVDKITGKRLRKDS